MAQKKDKTGKASGVPEKDKDSETDAEREAQLHREYDTVTETLSNLKRRAEQKRRDNEVLQNEVNRIRVESQELTVYMSMRTQKHNSKIDALSDLRQEKLEELNNQREKIVKKHKELVNGLKKEILEKESELAIINCEIAELGDVKSLKQQQLGRIAKLEQEVMSAHCHHSETLNALKDKCFTEKERCKTKSKHTLREVTLKANNEASLCLLSYIEQMSEENDCLHKELQQLVQRAQALRSHQQILQMKRRQLLLEKENVQVLQRLRTPVAQGASTHK